MFECFPFGKYYISIFVLTFYKKFDLCIIFNNMFGILFVKSHFTQWQQSDVASFINEKLNYWPMHYPIEEYRTTFINHWKCWLWLEDHSFDFFSNSYSGLISSYKAQIGFASEVSEHEEQLVVFEIRNAMRGILKLPPLTHGDFEFFRKIHKLLPIKYFAYYDRNVKNIAPSPDEMDFISRGIMKILDTSYESRLSIFRACMQSRRDGKIDIYHDNFTGAGDLPLIHDEKSEDIIFWETVGTAVSCEIETLYPNIENNARGEILKLVKAHLSAS